MYCDVVNVQPRFNFSDNKVILNLQCWVDILGTAGVQCTAYILSAHRKIFVHGLPWLLALLLYYIEEQKQKQFSGMFLKQTGTLEWDPKESNICIHLSCCHALHLHEEKSQWAVPHSLSVHTQQHFSRKSPLLRSRQIKLSYS